MKYVDHLVKSMEFLAEDPKVLFLDDIVPEEDKGLNLDCDFIDDEPVITKSKKYKKLKKYKKTKKKLADECDFID